VRSCVDVGRGKGVKVAAYQARLLPAGSAEAIGLIRRRVEQCEAEGVTILCCPEAILGGLADYADDPSSFAISTTRIESALAPLASDAVTTIVGLTELTDAGLLYNAAAVLHRGAVLGVYRKLHPAINRSVYAPGRDTLVFVVSGLTFGIIICNDSNFREPASRMATRGATVLFVPTNTGLPPTKGGPELVARTRHVDVGLAKENGLWVVRADVAGRTAALVAHGTSEIVDPRGLVSRAATELNEELLMVEIEVGPTRELQ
jgi:predicted amidohydrolase